MTDQISIAAYTREKEAELEYFKTRNLNLSQAIENLSQQLKDALDRIKQLEQASFDLDQTKTEAVMDSRK